MRNNGIFKTAASWVMLILLITLLAQGCGKKTQQDSGDETKGRPESITAYDAVQYTEPTADKWYPENWMIQVRDGTPEGVSRNGKAKVWEVFYFSPTPEEKSQFMVIYNRGHVWPSIPSTSKGGDEGQAIFRKKKPPGFRVDSPEAYTVAVRNGGGEYMDAHPDAQAHATLRCRADYEAVGDKMPGPKYKWIWDVSFQEPKIDAEILHLYVDGMNGDFITKEVQKPSV